MKAVYCIYCTEPQRKVWTQPKALPGLGGFQTGCLLADAASVPCATTKLGEIEEQCRPWHHLFAPAVLTQIVEELESFDAPPLVQVVSNGPSGIRFSDVSHRPGGPTGSAGWDAPTVDDLNDETEREFDWTGVAKTTDEDQARLAPETERGWQITRSDEERLRELGICRMMAIDVRGGWKTEY